jgi:prepilin-type N-terminal cleavage/methylation domain-containing protein
MKNSTLQVTPSALGRVRSVRRGLSLIEIVLSVVIISILVMVVAPQLHDVTDNARENSSASNLRRLQNAIESYIFDHGFPPSYATEGDIPQLTNTTDSSGRVGEGPSFDKGPYLPEGIPINPLNDSNYAHGTMEEEFEATAFQGWVYYPRTGQVWPGEMPRKAKSASEK